RDESGTANGNVYYGTHKDNSPNLNGWWMSTGNNNGTYTTAEDQNSAVKTFVAPKSGYVTISFADKLYSATNSSPDAKITVSSNGAISKVWPKDADFYTLPKTESGVITYIDETATFFVNEGDEKN
ncbi:MAG: hypothetical protein IIW10_00870, partial [Spirochaetaceae bacterium]|nr:hypothetical protein [Spirochaetaceae bacterium]